MYNNNDEGEPTSLIFTHLACMILIKPQIWKKLK